jgi:phage-related protein
MKPVHWVGSSREDLKSFPTEVKRDIGFALDKAQRGDKDPSVKPLQGFGGASILEIVENHDGDTYRAVYTVRLLRLSMCCIVSRRNRSVASRHRRRNLTLSQRV